MQFLFGGLFLGWALGANDASNVFGTAVASGIVRFRNAAVICSAAIILGAMLQGQNCMHTVSNLSEQTAMTLLIGSFAAAVTVTMMICLKLPISAAQAVIGAVSGVGLAAGTMNWSGLEKIMICWIATPIGALILACVIYKILAQCMMRIPMSMLTRDKILWGGLLIVGAYGSYALGANGVANAVGMFSGRVPGFSDSQLAFLGGIAIAGGVITFGKRMMFAVGDGLMRLDAFSAFTAVFAMAVTLHVFAFVGVPVSARQAIIGAILGVGLMRGVHTLRFKALGTIGVGWFITPAISLILAAAGVAIFCR